MLFLSSEIVLPCLKFFCKLLVFNNFGGCEISYRLFSFSKIKSKISHCWDSRFLRWDFTKRRALLLLRLFSLSRGKAEVCNRRNLWLLGRDVFHLRLFSLSLGNSRVCYLWDPWLLGKEVFDFNLFSLSQSESEVCNRGDSWFLGRGFFWGFFDVWLG